MFPVVVVAQATAAPLDSVFTDPAAVIRVGIGQTFVIALDANRTTGYSWSLSSVEGDVVENLGSPYLPSHSGRLGAGGRQLWIFRATHAGPTALNLRYVRPFEPNAQGAKSVTFQVVVAGP